jgi:predicted nucleic acid-binding protein
MLLDGGPDGDWATRALDGAVLIAPDLIGFETLTRSGVTRSGACQAAQAHADLLDLSIEHRPYELLAGRAWELRHDLSVYDASYVALAELTGSTLVTLDQRMPSAPGVRCAIATPGSPA